MVDDLFEVISELVEGRLCQREPGGRPDRGGMAKGDGQKGKQMS